MRRGSVLLAVLAFAFLLEAVVLSLSLMTTAQLQFVEGQAHVARAHQNAMSGLTMAMVMVNSAPYNAGPGGDKNAALYNADPTDDGQPGSYIVRESGVFEVQVNRIGDSWYELHAYGYGEENATRHIVLRVRERDYFSRWNMYAENGWVVVDDTNRWYGRVHSNNTIRFRNRLNTPRETLSAFDYRGNWWSNRSWDKGARFYAQVTSHVQPEDYAESGGRADAAFLAAAPVWNAPEIEFPPTQELSALGNSARQGATKTDLYKGGAKVGELYIGPNGISVKRTGSRKLFTFLKFINNPPGSLRKVRVKVRYDKDGDGVAETSDNKVYEQTLDVPQNGIIHSSDDIVQLEGELNGRVNVVCENGEVLVSDDIYYEDDAGQKAVIYNPSDPGGENFWENTNYSGTSCLGVMAKKSVYLANYNGDQDLVLCGVFGAGVGGSDYDGSFSWLPYGESRTVEHKSVSWSTTKRDLRVFGAMLSDGNNNGWAHWKGYTYGGGRGGYNSSLFRYDNKLVTQPPPKYMQINMPMYAGWQLVR